MNYESQWHLYETEMHYEVQWHLYGIKRKVSNNSDWRTIVSDWHLYSQKLLG